RANLQKLHIFPDTLQNNIIHQEYYQNEENCYYLPVADSLTGTLDLSSFPRLRKLTINQQFINRLILTGCQQLRELDADGNLLRKVILPLRAHRLKSIRARVDDLKDALTDFLELQEGKVEDIRLWQQEQRQQLAQIQHSLNKEPGEHKFDIHSSELRQELGNIITSNGGTMPSPTGIKFSELPPLLKKNGTRNFETRVLYELDRELKFGNDKLWEIYHLEEKEREKRNKAVFKVGGEAIKEINQTLFENKIDIEAAEIF
ncbi:6899_t:CDS:2, partial [Cetraspora pellucida]